MSAIQDNLKLDEENFVAWNAHDVDHALSLYSNDIVFVDVSSPEVFRGKDAVRQYIQAWFSAFPDMKITVKNRVIDENQVSGELEFVGTNKGAIALAPSVPPIPATGRKINGKGTYFVRIKNGKAVEVHTYPDLAGMLMQLGLMPMPNSVGHH